MAHLPHNLVVFGHLLRSLGVDTHLDRVIVLVEALQLVDISAREEVYHTCRALLVHRHEDFHTFDAAFDAFWREHGQAFGDDLCQPRREGRPEPPAAPVMSVAPIVDDPAVDRAADDSPRADVPAEAAAAEAAAPEVTPSWSAISGLAHKDFAAFTADEMAIARVALEQLEWHPGERRTRRWARGRGNRVDLRAAIRQSVRTGGEVVTLPTRQRRRRPRRLVLLCDISGSMEPYARVLLQFAHALGRRHQLEVFLFSTKLTRVTSELAVKGVDDAVAAVATAVPDWSGGTRIGDALRTLHLRWRRRALRGSAVVLLVSDGWDRGDPEVLRAEVARLQRNCHRLIWLNPLIGTKDYAPLTRGLRAALPFVDDFLPVRTLTNLADLAVHLNALDRRGPAHTRY
jgi:uncharacterized protein with von Willebrand factor type A (vWA) domain